jgi:hypothetical protein
MPGGRLMQELRRSSLDQACRCPCVRVLDLDPGRPPGAIGSIAAFGDDGLGANAAANEQAAPRAAEQAKRAEAERARLSLTRRRSSRSGTPGGLVGARCGSIRRRAITSKLPARQHAANFSSPDDRHNLRDRASVPGRRTAKPLATIHDRVQSPRFT